MTNFEKDTIELELLSDDFEMVETDDAKVLDTTQVTPKEIARLKNSSFIIPCCLIHYLN